MQLFPCGHTDTDGDNVGDLVDSCPNDPLLSTPPPDGWSCHQSIDSGWYTTGAAIAKLSPTSGMAFIAGIDRRLWYRTFTLSFTGIENTIVWNPASNQVWSGPEPGSFNMVRTPSAVASSGSLVHLVTLDDNYKTWYKNFTITTSPSGVITAKPGSWIEMGTSVASYSSPVITYWGKPVGRLDVFSTSADFKLKHKYSDDLGRTWKPSLSSFEYLGVTSDPVIGDITAGGVDTGYNIFWRSSGILYQYYPPAAGNPNVPISYNQYPLTQAPHTTGINGVWDLITQTPEGVKHWGWNGGFGWTNMVTIGGNYTFEPTITAFESGKLLVTGVYPDGWGKLYWRTYNGPINRDYLKNENQPFDSTKSLSSPGLNMNIVVGISIGCTLLVLVIIGILIVLRMKKSQNINNDSLTVPMTDYNSETK